MSKTETVRSLSDSAPTPTQLQATIELQRQMSMLTAQVQELRRVLAQWTQHSLDASQKQSGQMLEVAALIGPVLSLMKAIHQQQQVQDQLTKKFERDLSRVMAFLPVQKPGLAGGPRVHPKLATREDVQAVPIQVWKTLLRTFTWR